MKFGIISTCLFAIILTFFQGCFFSKNSLSIKNAPLFLPNNSNLSSVNIANDQVTITGSGFSDATTVRLKGNGVDTDLNIASKTDTQIVATATSALSLLASGTFDLIIGTATASTTYSITFTLQDGSVTASKLASMSATSGQVLKFNGTNWAPSFLAASQNYKGTWNPNTNLPDDITSIGAYTPGDYYIVNTAGSFSSGTLTSSPTTFAVGNWVMFNGSTWDKVLNGNLSGAGTTNFIPYYNSSTVLANSPMYISGGNVGIGTTTPGSILDVKGVLRLSGSTSGYVGIQPPAVAGSTTYTLPSADGTNGQVLSTNASGVLSWATIATSGGTLTSISSANTDIGITSPSTTPVLTLNSGTGASQIVKLTAASKLPAVDGSLLTNLTSGNLVGAVPIANGGTGATDLGTSQSALGITLAGSLTGNVPSLGAGVIADRLCASDSSGGTISCINNLPAATVRSSVNGTSGTGNLLFGTSPTITSPVITNIAPAADFTLTQNSVVPFTSINSGAVANTLYLNAGKVGIGTTTPSNALEVEGDLSIGRASVGNGGTLYFRTSAGTYTVYPVSTNTMGTNVRWKASSGSAASPGLGFTSDLASGLYLPSASNLSVVTAGVERMRFDNIGNVGIGTTSPGALLHAVGTTEQLRLGYDASNYSSFTTNVNGALSINSGGTNQDISLLPSGTGYSVLGTNIKAGSTAIFDGNNFHTGTGANSGLIGSDTNLILGNLSDNYRVTIRSTGLVEKSTDIIGFTNGASYNGTIDSAFSRISAGIIGIGTGAAGSYAGTLAVGNIGIGTTSPAGKLQIANSSNKSIINIQDTNIIDFGTAGDTSYNDVINMYDAGGSGGGINMFYRYNNAHSLKLGSVYNYVEAAYDGSQVIALSYDPSTGAAGGGVHFEYGTRNANYNDAAYPSTLSFSPRGLKATLSTLFLDQLGNVGIGTSSPASKLQVAGDITPEATNTRSLGSTSLRWTKIWTTDIDSTNAINISSDRRLKKNIQDTKLGLDFINLLRPVSYYWKSGNDKDLHYGLIAQETEKTLLKFKQGKPSSSLPIVSYDKKNDRYGIKYTELISPLIKAVQEVFTSIKTILTRLLNAESNTNKNSSEIILLKQRATSLEIKNSILEKDNQNIGIFLEC